MKGGGAIVGVTRGKGAIIGFLSLLCLPRGFVVFGCLFIFLSCDAGMRVGG